MVPPGAAAPGADCVVTPPHPASQIVLGCAVLVAASAREGWTLALATLVLVGGAACVAPGHLGPLLRRTRWLLLTLVAMFGWLTPGTPLAWVPGASEEGLALAAAHGARLLLALAVVALLLRSMAIPDLVAGMRSLLAPVAPLGVPRDRIAVRLALTLDEVEATRSGRDAAIPDVLSLPDRGLGAADWLAGLGSAILLLGTWLR